KLHPTDRSHALRGNASRDAPRSCLTTDTMPNTVVTQSVTGCIPTRSVGTINRVRELAADIREVMAG
ncbi:hypothetical protein, partial [Pseudomonas mandelii]|uniref:hypothetical protein n=1 Tax=Pseudomonas mandelii TaxID=75612 RepID=UPI00209DAB53